MSLLLAPRPAASAERDTLRHCTAGRRRLGVVELALPAATLHDNAVARWVRDRSVAVEVRDGHELVIARSAGVHPMRTMFARRAAATPI